MNSYKDIPGWMNFEEIYDQRVMAANGRDIFVEVGSWLGRSTCYMASKIRDSRKPIEFHAVDPFDGSGEDEGYKHHKAMGDQYEIYLSNIRALSLEQFVHTIRARSEETFWSFNDESISFVFLDGDHRYPAVRNDLENWWTKIKPGGILGGHDLQYDGVLRAVNQFSISIRQGYQALGNSYLFTKKEEKQ